MPPFDPNVLLNGAMLLGLLYFGPRAWKTAKLRAELAAKDEIIKTNEQSIAALTTRVDGLEVDLEGLSVRADESVARADRAEREVSDWRARYEEQSKYAAPEGFAHFEALLSSQGELSLKMLEVLSRIEHALDRR